MGIGLAAVAVACAGTFVERFRKREPAIAFAENVPTPASTSAPTTSTPVSSPVSAITCTSTKEKLQSPIHHVDVVVIGGGIVGCTVGYFLAKNGKNVAIIDRGPFELVWCGLILRSH